VLVVTGAVNLGFQGVDAARLFDASFWGTSFGKTLAHEPELVAGSRRPRSTTERREPGR
jgi:hypothetical protein